MTGRVSMCLVHHPVLDKAGEVYSTSITNLDVHDCARTARTYDLAAFYVVHPVLAQRDLGQRIIDFWKEDKSKRKNADRWEAMQRAFVVEDLEAAIQREVEATGVRPRIWSTSARAGSLPYHAARSALVDEHPTMLLFGTGHGLAPAALAMANDSISPISGRVTTGEPYNHLSVRAAVAITIDRLLGDDE